MRAAPWVLASRNHGKLAEMRALLESCGIGVIDLGEAGVAEDPAAEEAIEAYETFEENALAKARYFSGRLSGRIVVADDSGLSVDALGGAPGVRSKRWSTSMGLGVAPGDNDAANNAMLVQRLGGVADRRARFVCAAAWTDGVDEVVVRGEVPGVIVDEARGTHGFGYDPHFRVDELGMTLAEATMGEKERVSHRGRAFAGLLRELRARGLMMEHAG